MTSKEPEEFRGVTLKRAGEIIGGDKPLSVRIISRMIARGDLKSYGRRVTMRSINAYTDGERTEQDNAALSPVISSIPSHLPKRRGGRRARPAQSTLVEPYTFRADRKLMRTK